MFRVVVARGSEIMVKLKAIWKKWEPMHPELITSPAMGLI